MKLKALERGNLENAVYYVVHVWYRANTWGHSYPIAYKTERNAVKQADKLWNSGDYECITVCKEEVEKRNAYTEYSTSSVVRHYRNGSSETWCS